MHSNGKVNLLIYNEMLNGLMFITITLVLSLCFSGVFLKKFEKKLFIGFDKKDGIQKIHLEKSTRLGGLSIITVMYFVLLFNLENKYTVIFYIFTFPVFLIGFIEDITNKLSVKSRLMLLFLSCTLPVIIFDMTIKGSDIFLINILIDNPILATLFSILGIVVTANAWNFIDGLNGLSSGLGLLILLTFSYIAKLEAFYDLSYILSIIALISFGFWLINIITSKIFLGDSGAYLLGLIIAISGIEISNKSENISAWLIFFIIIYPATEIVFTFVRRLGSIKSPTVADDQHLHSLIYKFFLGFNFKISKNFINSFSGLVCLLIGSLPLIYFYSIANILYIEAIYGSIIFIIFYILLYMLLKKVTKENIVK